MPYNPTMDEAYHKAFFERFGDDDFPPLAVRRHTDRCFFRVEEITPDGCVVEGHLFTIDEIAELREQQGDDAPECTS